MAMKGLMRIEIYSSDRVCVFVFQAYELLGCSVWRQCCSAFLRSKEICCRAELTSVLGLQTTPSLFSSRIQPTVRHEPQQSVGVDGGGDDALNTK